MNTDTTTAIRESDTKEIKNLLLGHRITAAETGDYPVHREYWDDTATGRLTLDNGTHVYVLPNQGCGGCPSGNYDLTHLATVDNIITDVRAVGEAGPNDAWSYGPTSYRIYVIADATEINVLQVDGDDGNGYYGTGYELLVVPAEANR